MATTQPLGSQSKLMIQTYAKTMGLSPDIARTRVKLGSLDRAIRQEHPKWQCVVRDDAYANNFTQILKVAKTSNVMTPFLRQGAQLYPCARNIRRKGHRLRRGLNHQLRVGSQRLCSGHHADSILTDSSTRTSFTTKQIKLYYLLIHDMYFKLVT